jgi:integrase
VTAVPTGVLTVVRTSAPRPDDLAAMRALLRPQFLAEAGWDPDDQVLAPPRDHPLLGLRKCVVVDCHAGVRGPAVQLCKTCEERHNRLGKPPIDDFAATVSGKHNAGERRCVVGCTRPARVREGLCTSHAQHRRKHPDLSLTQWLALPGIVVLPSFGQCVVASCIRLTRTGEGLCGPHIRRWQDHRRAHPAARQGVWLRTADPIGLDHIVIFKGLPERLQVELLLGLQTRTDAGIRTFLTVLRYLVALARRRRAASISDLAAAPISRTRNDVSAMVRLIARDLRRVLTTPETEQTKDIWDLAVWGLNGALDFTQVSQPWLRQAAQMWALEDLPLHRGRQASATARTTLTTLGRLSQTLRLSREDAGDDPAALGRRDIVAFLNRLAHLQHTGQLSEYNRLHTIRRIRRFFDDIRTFGLTRPGQPLAGLPVDFALRQSDLPREADPDRRGRDLPTTVLRELSDNLHRLEDRSGIGDRRIVELLIDTGRRPNEICRLRWDCLDRDPSGKPVLVYTDFKNNRPDQRLPIAEATSQIILAQKDLVRARFPDTPIGDLALFPRDRTNPRGTKTAKEAAFAHGHRWWVEMIAAELVDADGQPFDPAVVTPYAYRHSYAQRHADQGIAPDVLRDLMGHKSMQTTQSYYRVTETRVRGAIDRVARHQFDGHGRRVFQGIAALLADEHVRMRVGQVAVPFGICTEPSNVKASGQACPYKFTCLGCGHFRSDVSYLPELKSYLQQLLADRERLRAATDIDAWVRDHLMPPDEEISQLRALIHRIEDNLDALSAEDRQQISDAITVVRKARQTVTIGMPTVRPPKAVGE